MDQTAVSVSRGDPDLLEFMRATRPFERLSEDVLRLLCGRMTRMRIAAGQNLFEKNVRGDSMYVVISGRAATVKKTVDLNIQPPMKRFRMNQFKALEETAETGYRHAAESVKTWLAARPEVARFLPRR